MDNSVTEIKDFVEYTKTNKNYELLQVMLYN